MRIETNREAQRRWRERNRAMGLNGDGSPRTTRAPGSAPPNYLEHCRRDVLEAITWMTGKRGHDPARLLGVHAFAANLPLTWWANRDNHSINTLIEAIEHEMESLCPQPK